MFEFETSKAVIEVESEKDGIVSLNVEVGQIVPVGWIAAIIDDKFVNFDKKKDNFEKFRTQPVRGTLETTTAEASEELENTLKEAGVSEISRNNNVISMTATLEQVMTVIKHENTVMFDAVPC